MIKTKERHQYLHTLRMRIILLIEVGSSEIKTVDKEEKMQKNFDKEEKMQKKKLVKRTKN